MILFKKIALFLGIISFTASVSHNNALNASVINKMALGVVATVGTVSVSHIYGWYTCYCFQKELYATSTSSHTWNLLDEVFPTVFEMTQAPDEAAQKIKKTIRTFNVLYQTDPAYLVHFIDDAQRDTLRLNEMKEYLQGGGYIDLFIKKFRNDTLFRYVRGTIEELVTEITRYQKRLSYIIQVVTTSSEFHDQLVFLRAQGNKKVSYSVKR